jgi:hypothetical protein
MEVKNVEELSRRLGDVWLGTFKLRVNLSRFAKGSSSSSSHPKPLRPVSGGKEVLVNPEKTFKSMLISGGHHLVDRGVKGVGGQEGALKVGLESDFLAILKKSFVGRLVKGGETKSLQLNLFMEGYREVKVATLGGGRVLIFCESGVDLEHVLKVGSWWKGVLENIVPWSVNIVPLRRDIWVNIYGVPLQC